mmetsp:Transcript_16176/g.44513  ORF Transcript_16176/g.44513 Transcript_16176/m.44513 type:complete len:273 (+) Transcript_16176:1181-1999(+)
MDRAELHQVVTEEDVPRDGEAHEDGGKDNQEVEQLVGCVDEGVGHQLEARVGLEGLEELEHDRHHIDTHDQLQRVEQLHDAGERRLRRFERACVQAHHVRDQRQVVVFRVQQVLDGIPPRGHAEHDPDNDVGDTHDDADPVNPVPEAPVLLAAAYEPAYPDLSQDVLYLAVSGIEDEQHINDVHRQAPPARVRDYDHRTRHDVRNYEAPVVEPHARLGDSKHLRPLVPRGEDEFHGVGLVVVPARLPEGVHSGLGRSEIVPGVPAQVLLGLW